MDDSIPRTTLQTLLQAFQEGVREKNYSSLT